MSLAYQDPLSARPVASDDEIPVLDFGPYRAGEPGALERLGLQMRYTCENVGFHFIVNHGVTPAQMDTVFTQAARFHALPVELKQALKVNEHQIGYMPYKSYTSRSSRVHENTQPNLIAAYFLKRDLAPDHPDVILGPALSGDEPMAGSVELAWVSRSFG